MILTTKERRRFIQWLEQDIESNRLLIVQAKKLPQGELIIRKLQPQMGAEIIVLMELRSIEDD